MERRKAVRVAAAISGALLVGALAMTANAGILDAPNNDKVGQLTPVVATPPPTIIYIEDPAGAMTTTAPPPTAASPTVSHDDGGHDSEHRGSERDD
jgi:hypothetical protein